MAARPCDKSGRSSKERSPSITCSIIWTVGSLPKDSMNGERVLNLIVDVD